MNRTILAREGNLFDEKARVTMLWRAQVDLIFPEDFYNLQASQMVQEFTGTKRYG